MVSEGTIVGPVMAHLHGVIDGDNIGIATAFYSARCLESIRPRGGHVDFLVRLNLRDWAAGGIDPPALLALLTRFRQARATVNLRIHPGAHAKVYVGPASALVGSANLTIRGFGGGLEVVQCVTSPSKLREVQRKLKVYGKSLDPMSLDELENFIAKYARRMRRLRARLKAAGALQNSESRLPSVSRDLRPHLGTYQDFLVWLARRGNAEPARETLARARGKGQLQGHIHRNFYGLRQFLITYPEEQRRFRGRDAGLYKLSADPDTEHELARFVRHQATDEDDFELDVWKTYLPRECGGRAGKHGGTIGNLNRMLPLVARYMEERLRR